MIPSDRFSCRAARREDLRFLVELLAEDVLGKERERLETPLPDAYARALDEIISSDFTTILIVENDREPIGSLQLTFIPHLSYVGQRRAIIESVHVLVRARGNGAGEFLAKEAIALAQRAGCGQIVLTSSNSRDAAHRFWRRIGFRDTHLGFKLHDLTSS